MYQFSLQNVDRRSELHDFARYTLASIKYLDYKTLEEELLRIQLLHHIEFYWILCDGKRVGVVKFSLFYFYDFGLFEEIDDQNLEVIFMILEEKLRKAFTGRLQGNIESTYLPVSKNIGWKEEYSRYRMFLDFSKVKGMSDYSKIKYTTARNFDLHELHELFSSAYSGSIDEKIGLITRSTIDDSISDIKYGKYGDLLEDQSIIAYNRWGRIIGASLITFSENSAFLVIIGVRRNQQHKGLGRKLLTYNIEKSIEAGFTDMKLWVTMNNSAVRFYESMGFEVLNRVSSIYKPRLS
ncbi:MAG: GNAT family N-acetyltransferase [Candidatus Heimdallarchaeota archaeon]|nr:GNAT family N-acetyltransferase [Candidatus Heimdallarchaeota archaeon]